MDRPTLETLVHVPWGGDLPRVAVDQPRRGDVAGVETWTAPALPLVRVDHAGALALLAYLDGRFAAGDTIAWATASGGALSWHRAPDPFAADRAAVTALDFCVDGQGDLTVLETIGGARSQVIAASAGGTSRGVALEGGPYVRLVPDDRGRLYLVRHQGGPALVPFDPATGATAAPIAVTPGSPLALAANRAAVVPAAMLAAPPSGTVAAPSALPQALVFLFGVDGKGDYYTRVDDDVAAVTFAGKLRSRVSLATVPELQPPATGAVRGQLAPTPSWQVDGDGRIYVARATPDALEVVRMTLPR